MKKTVSLNIHDILKIKVINPSISFFKDLNLPYAYFLTEDRIEPDIEVKIGCFKEDLGGCATVDHKYFVKKDYIFFKDAIGPLSWKAELHGLESQRYRIKISYGAFNKLVFPNSLYPDQILYNFLLYPILERCFLKKGYLFLHAGAAASGKRGIVFAGRGGAYKTSIIMNLAKCGLYSLGDGWIILKGNEVYSFPTSVSFFDYRRRNLPDENLSLYHKLNITRFLLKSSPKKGWIKDRACLEFLFIIYRKDLRNVEIEEISDKDAVVEMLSANNRLEWKANLPYKYDISKFFDAYEYVCTSAENSDYVDTFRNTLRDSLRNTKVYKMQMPLTWRAENIDAVKDLIKF